MRIVIIGNGVAGITAARYLRKLSDHEIIVVSEEAPYHFSRPAMMYVSMGHMTYDNTKPYEDWFWKKNRIELVHDAVSAIAPSFSSGDEEGFSPGKYVVAMLRGETIDADTIIFATGSEPAWFGWTGEHLPGVQAYVHKSDLEALERNVQGARNAVVVGGGLIGVEAAEVLHARGLHVTMLVRESGFYRRVFPAEESDIITKHIAAQGIDLRLSTELDRIVGGENGGRVDHVITSSGERIQADVVILATGVKPTIDLAKQSGLNTDRGILINDRFETSLPNVFAIGDCAQFEHGVEQLWYTARAHGEHVARVIIEGAGPYVRGTYFNSAKFFELEWQVYGEIPADSDSTTSEYWSELQPIRCLRIAHRNGVVIGIHGIGVRLRQDVCTTWIDAGATIEVVRKNIQSAVFDPEFTRKVTV
ncbi:MAG: NAD(P)/FAD-dependent oxidoreductase [Candidatus Kapabacteria bacterium]|nr:NAD(P)/FAD-dependent oxidoreductase [Candidatus Kapabacteria bacterium]